MFFRFGHRCNPVANLLHSMLEIQSCLGHEHFCHDPESHRDSKLKDVALTA